MDQSTQRMCSIDGCGEPFHAKTWCKYHYKRAWKTGDPLTPRQPRTPKADAMARRGCSVDGCESLVGSNGARGFCPLHYERWKRTGKAGAAGSLTMPRTGVCVMDGCGSVVLARGMCRLHRERVRRTGVATLSCAYCGCDLTNIPRARRFCSNNHAAMYSRHEGSRPESLTCQRCGWEFSILGTGKAGRTKRADSKMCPECRKARTTRHGWSVTALVAHHGSTDCGICGEPVDLKLKAPEMMRPSIDHITPFAHGGSNEPENLQLAHLHCNHVKSDSGYVRGRRVKLPL